MKYFFSSLVLILMVGFVSSCSKNSESIDIAPSKGKTQAIDDNYEFNKDVKLVTPSGVSATMRIYSDSKLNLEEYSGANFKLTQRQPGESVEDALVRVGLLDPTQKAQDEPIDGDLYGDDQAKSDFAFELLSNGVSGLIVTFIHPESVQSRGWHYYTHYSTALQNTEQTASITRHSFWRRVYFGMYYKAYSGSSWSTIQNSWKKLHNNETFSKDKNPCYQFKIRVKTKRSSAYSVNFDY